MATEREVRRAVKAADRRAKAQAKAAAAREKSISTRVGEGRPRSPEDCCTPKMAGQVLSRLGAKARKAAAEERQRIRDGRASTKRAKQPAAANKGRPELSEASETGSGDGTCACKASKGDETIYDVARDAGLHVYKATWRKAQSTPSAVFFDLESGLPVGLAPASAMFEEARRLAALRSAGKPLPQLDASNDIASVERSDKPAEFWRKIDRTWPFQYASARVEDWGSGRGRGKRVGKMVTGAMSDAPRGTKVYVDVLGRAGFARDDREVLGNLGRDAELLAARALAAGLSHRDALTVGFVAANGRDRLRPEQAYKALLWTTEDAGAEAREPARPMVPAPSSSPPIRMDDALRDLKSAAADGYIERKHVAKALRQMLQARYRGGFSVTTPNHSMATTLDVEPKGASRFTDAHRAALIDIFDSDPGNSGQFMVLVSPFVNDSSSIPTGIRGGHVDEFRRLVAKAAALPAPERYEEPAAPAPAPPSMFEPLTDGEIEQLGALTLQSLKQRGVPARMKVPAVGRIDGTVLIQGKDASIELRRNPRGFHARLLAGVNSPEARAMLEALKRDAAPVFGRKPHQASGRVTMFTALHPDKRKANWERAAQSWARKNINVEQFDDAPAANGKPSRISIAKPPGFSAAQLAKAEELFIGTSRARWPDMVIERVPRSDDKVVFDVSVPTDAIAGKGRIGIQPWPGGFNVTMPPGQTKHSSRAFRILLSEIAPLLGKRRSQIGNSTEFLSHRPEMIDKNLAQYAEERRKLDGPADADEEKAIARAEAAEARSGPTLGVGREDFEERKDRRVERLERRSKKAMAQADAHMKKSDQLAQGFWMGQPILIGHHSEKRARRDQRLIHEHAFKSLDAAKKGRDLARRAAAADANSSISGDDPRAVEKLRERLAELEANRDETKRKNTLARAGKLPDAENPENPPHIQSLAGKRVYPVPSYVLKNLGAEIRRVQERLEQLSKRQGRVARVVERGGVRVVENGDINRLQVFTEGKPPQENRTWLKRHGFRWARSEGAWQRQIGDSSWNLGMEYLDTFVEKRDDTPFQSVEAPKSKPNYTDQDLAFWRDEFAKLDEEFPGEFTEGYDDAWEALKTSLRKRKSGDPQGQASAYVQYRLGNWSVEEAVKNLYFGRRYAKPKPRPKRAAKVTSSTMSVDAFLAAVTEGAKGLPGQLRLKASSLGGRDSAHVSHYNIPEGSRDEARAESNRLSLLVNGWERDGAPPRSGKVKLEVLVSSRLRGLRGRTTTPEKMVGVVVEMLQRHAMLG